MSSSSAESDVDEIMPVAVNGNSKNAKKRLSGMLELFL